MILIKSEIDFLSYLDMDFWKVFCYARILMRFILNYYSPPLVLMVASSVYSNMFHCFETVFPTLKVIQLQDLIWSVKKVGCKIANSWIFQQLDKSW